MNRCRSSLLRRLPRVRLAGGSCLAVLFLFAATPLAPVLTSLLARADHSHQVTIQHTPDGIRVVLHHKRIDCQPHRHGIVARALTLVAQSANAANPDHVIQFNASASFSWPAELNESWCETLETPDFAVKKVFLASLSEDFQSPVPTHPPPMGDAQLVCLHSTLLLI